MPTVSQLIAKLTVALADEEALVRLCKANGEPGLAAHHDYAAGVLRTLLKDAGY